MGGGIILDGIHEIDYISWFLGAVNKVACFSGKLSSLQIDTEDTAEIMLQFQNGAIAEVHLDYIQRYYARSCQIIGEQGTILWDIHEKQVRLYSSSTGEWQTFPEKPGYDLNEMYIDEIKYFIECVKERKTTMSDVTGGAQVLKIAIAAKESASGGSVSLIR
jgi:predicted dehydrogenase